MVSHCLVQLLQLKRSKKCLAKNPISRSVLHTLVYEGGVDCSEVVCEFSTNISLYLGIDTRCGDSYNR